MPPLCGGRKNHETNASNEQRGNGMRYARTIHIYGMVVRSGTVRGKRDKRYQDPDTVPVGGEPTFTYHTVDDVTIDDIMYYLDKKGVRIAPVDGEGNKLDTVIAIDNNRPVRPGEKILTRVGVYREIEKDLARVKWVKPKE